MHLRFVVSLYRMQLENNRHFLHEHPHGAASSNERCVLELLSHLGWIAWPLAIVKTVSIPWRHPKAIEDAGKIAFELASNVCEAW